MKNNRLINIKSEKGITLVILIITIIVMIILVKVGIDIGTNSISQAKLEDLKTNMLSIQGKAKIIDDKHTFESAELVGTPIANNTYTINSALQTILNNNSTGNYYIWDRAILDSQSLNSIKLSENEFYIVDYSTNEVYNSLGWKNKYSLTEIQGLEE